MTNNENSTDKETSPNHHRLPCRGCTRNCSDYVRCNGKPWRLIDNKGNNVENKT